MARTPFRHSAAVLAGLLALVGAAAAAGHGARRLVVLQAGEAVEYDATTFAVTRRIPLPADAFANRAALSMNALGQMLFVPAEPRERLWLWNGSAATYLARGTRQQTRRAGTRQTTLDAVPECRLSADGRHLFWFENRFERMGAADETAEVPSAVNTTFHAWQTDFNGQHRTEIATSNLGRCACATGICEETCPQIAVWTPDAGVADFFLATKWIPGQIDRTYQSSDLYRFSTGRWAAARLPLPIEEPLDAASQGEVIIHAVPDAGCCGWQNETDDRTLLERRGKTTVLFDERQRYGNVNYDVSFYTSNAALSPNLRAVAMTVAASAESGASLPLSLDGKPDSGELARLTKALADLPAVEVASVDGAAVNPIRILRATLVGWLNEQEIVIADKRGVAVVNVATGARRSLAIQTGGDIRLR